MIPRITNNQAKPCRMESNEPYQGLTLIEQLRIKTQNRESPEIIVDTFYTRKAEGVLDTLNIRADRFDIGLRESERIQNYRDRKKGHLKKSMETTEAPTGEEWNASTGTGTSA